MKLCRCYRIKEMKKANRRRKAFYTRDLWSHIAASHFSCWLACGIFISTIFIVSESEWWKCTEINVLCKLAQNAVYYRRFSMRKFITNMRVIYGWLRRRTRFDCFVCQIHLETARNMQTLFDQQTRTVLSTPPFCFFLCLFLLLFLSNFMRFFTLSAKLLGEALDF